jgi:hypothetical protein
MYAEDDDHPLPSAVRLSQILGCSAVTRRHLQDQPVDMLCLSVRASNCLLKTGIHTFGQLLDCSVEQLLRINNMGRKSAQEVVSRLEEFLRKVDPTDSAPTEPAGALSFTLLQEWTTFSGAEICDADMPVECLALSNDIRRRLAELDVTRLEQLLGWTLPHARATLGEDAVEEVLGAIVPAAGEHRSDSGRLVAIGSERQRSILARRWSAAPLSAIGLTEETRGVLEAAGIRTLKQLLDGLESLHPVLWVDLAAFHEVWERLVALGLREGEAAAARRQQLTAHGSVPDLASIIA